jgi:hypothetical protein
MKGEEAPRDYDRFQQFGVIMAHHEHEHGRERDVERNVGTTTSTEGTARTYETSGYGGAEVAMMAPGRRFSWSAIFSGAFVALVLMILLNMLGVAIGAAVLDPTGGVDAQGFGIGAGLWYTISGLIALFFGGWVAGRIGGYPERFESFLYGLVTWGLVSIVTFYFLTTAMGQIVGGAVGVVGQTFGAATDVPMITQTLEQQLADVGVTQEQIQQIQQDATVIADDVSTAVAVAAFWAFLSMLLGGLAAAFGSRVGARSLFEEEPYRSEQRSKSYVGRVRHA